MNVSPELDAIAPVPLLVFGSLPPGGNDVDVLVPDAAIGELADAMRSAGFVQRGEEWARFRDCTADVADLVPASDWRLRGDALDALLADARPIAGHRRLVRPAPAHALLILARRLVHSGGTLDAKRRARVDAALAEDAGAWEAARAAAPAWRSTRALAALERAYADGVRIARPERVRAIAEERGPRRALGRAVRRGGRPGFVVSFSGLDGAGKSTQAEALRETLGELGIEAEVVWSSLIAHASLEWIARPVKRALALVRRGAPPPEPAGPDETWSESAPTMKPDHGTHLRRRVPAISFVWTMLSSLNIGRHQRRETRARLRRGQIVLCDRYDLDTKVHLRYEYGERSYRLQMGLIRLLSPAPKTAFLLEVAPETAHARKGEYELHQLERRAALYREEAARMGAVVIDGEGSREDICAQVARTVWLA